MEALRLAQRQPKLNTRIVKIHSIWIRIDKLSTCELYFSSKDSLGNWKVRQEISPVDDSINFFASLVAEDALIYPLLVSSCQEGKTNLIIGYGTELQLEYSYSKNSFKQVPVLTRFDNGKASTEYWYPSINNKSIHVPNDKAVEFANKLRNSRKLFVRVTQDNGLNVDSLFNLKGADSAFKPLVESCQWDNNLSESEELRRAKQLLKEEVIDLRRVEKKPVILKKIKPRYPAAAQKDKITGKVFVTALVGKDGKVEQIGKITGPKIFHEVAKAAALQWEFTPAMRNDRPVRVWVSLPFIFRLK